MKNYPRLIRNISKVREKRWNMDPSSSINQKIKKLEEVFDKSMNPLDIFLEIWGKRTILGLKNTPAIDLVKELEKYSEEEVKIILSNTFALELNKGCTGGCYFCLYGKKPGVIKKYSFSSLKEFNKKYSHYLPSDKVNFRDIREKILLNYGDYFQGGFLAKIPDNTTVLYNDSDPLTYYDENNGDRFTFLDVFRLFIYQKNKVFTPALTTSLPIGTEALMGVFIDGIFFDKFKRNKEFPLLRFSLAKHNVQRIEETLIIIFHYLELLGYSLKQINEFFGDEIVCRYAIRDDKTLWKVGDLIDKADSYQEIISPHCIDGVVLSPGDFRNMVSISATKKTPSGVSIDNLSPGKVIDRVVKHETLQKYARYYDVPTELYIPQDHILHVHQLISRKEVIYPISKLAFDEKIFAGLNFQDNHRIFYLISRSAFSLSHFLLFIRSLDYLYKSGLVFSDNLILSFFEVAKNDYLKKRNYFLTLFKKSRKLTQDNSDYRYLRNLLLFYIKMTDFLILSFEKNNPALSIDLIKKMVLLGEKQSTEIDKIILYLRKKYDI